jgi:hypothetical protein
MLVLDADILILPGAGIASAKSFFAALARSSMSPRLTYINETAKPTASAVGLAFAHLVRNPLKHPASAVGYMTSGVF